MTEETKLIPIPMHSGVLVPRDFTEAFEMAKVIAESGMVPKDYINKPGAVLVAVQMGAEIGLSPMSAIQNIAVINGRPSIFGDAGLALVSGHPQFEDIEERLERGKTDDETRAVCIIKRRGRTPTVRTFSISDAKTAGLWKKAGPWTQYPKRMLQMRARWIAMRDSFPDALRGIKGGEEVIDIEQKPEYINEDGLPKAGKQSFVPEKPKTEPIVDAEIVSEPTEFDQFIEKILTADSMEALKSIGEYAPRMSQKQSVEAGKVYNKRKSELTQKPKQEEPPHDPKTGELIEEEQNKTTADDLDW